MMKPRVFVGFFDDLSSLALTLWDWIVPCRWVVASKSIAFPLLLWSSFPMWYFCNILHDPDPKRV